MKTSRRDFLATSAAAVAAAALPTDAQASKLEGAPALIGLEGSSLRARPCVVASANGIRGVRVAYDQIVAGRDTLDAIIAGVNIQELDPDDTSARQQLFSGTPEAQQRAEQMMAPSADPDAPARVGEPPKP